MADREKVINGLESCVVNKTKCFTEKDKMCPYFSVDVFQCERVLMRDALELLKEQEAMMQCIKGKCRICPHCANCDVNDNGLLKEQEAVKPILKREGRNKNYNDYYCPICDNEVVYEQNFCSECGRPFLWEGR